MTEAMFHYNEPRVIVPRSSGMPVAITFSRKQCRVIQRNGQTCDLLPVDSISTPLFRCNLPVVDL